MDVGAGMADAEEASAPVGEEESAAG
jgi:hypothetical protein